MALIEKIVVILPPAIYPDHGDFCDKQENLGCNCIKINGWDYYYVDGDADTVLKWLEEIRNTLA